MKSLVGTSGYSHPEWKGNFYPEKCSPKKMLGLYAERFPTVEVNYTFRRLPTPEVVDAWAQEVPASFRFVLKGPQSITHFKRLRNAEKATDDFLAAAAGLGKRLGPILLQLPPNFKKDVSRLDAFLNHLAGRAKVAFEFRNATWFDEEVYDCLRSHSAVLCVSDRDDLPKTGLVRTAKWGYVRMWNDRYTAQHLRKLSENISSQKWSEAYVIFMHEDEGISPKLATRFMKQCEP
jgi:uncharacterized protein YecE (DUF72 family)